MTPTKEEIENARDDLATRPAKAGLFRSTHRLCLAGLDALEREAKLREYVAKLDESDTPCIVAIRQALRGILDGTAAEGK